MLLDAYKFWQYENRESLNSQPTQSVPDPADEQQYDEYMQIHNPEHAHNLHYTSSNSSSGSNPLTDGDDEYDLYEFGN